MIMRLSLKKFRIFENTTIELGRMVTAIAGHNATGKSTLLGIIGNACELKAAQGKTITATQFKTEFSELFKGSKKYDSTGQIGSLFIQHNGKNTEIALRVAWQKYNTQSKELDRFRIIPKWTEQGRSTERKYPIPSLYLGLSRLYPLGEASNNEVKKRRRLRAMGNVDREWLYKTYNRILTIIDSIDSISNYSINKKISGGINTSKYDYLTNSSGQDNLMQILYALLSFKLLHKKIAARWKGGIFLIDEIDATLHPAAQTRLLDVILEVCAETGLQVVFTTHSLHILDYLRNGMTRNNKNVNIINYLTTANKKLGFSRNPEKEFIHNDMMIESSIQKESLKKVTVYSEDAETRWFLERLLSGYKRYVKIVNMNFGCEQAKSWIKSDPDYFKNILFVLDGEVEIAENDEKFKNIIKLPGTVPPERVLYNYLSGLDADHDYLNLNAKRGVTNRLITVNGPDSDKYRAITVERERNKKWFNDNVALFEDTNLYGFWSNDNQMLVNRFLGQFKHCHDGIVFRIGAEKMPALKVRK